MQPQPHHTPRSMRDSLTADPQRKQLSANMANRAAITASKGAAHVRAGTKYLVALQGVRGIKL